MDVGTKKVAVEPVEPNRVVRVSFHDFTKVGDLLAATLNVQSNAILEVKVSTWLESQKEGITLAVGFSQLPDGTSYSSRTILNAKSKEIKVVVENSATGTSRTEEIQTHKRTTLLAVASSISQEKRS